MIKDQDFEYERFTGLSITEQTIENCHFTDCEFIDCSFENCEVRRCSFSECIFKGCRINAIKPLHCHIRSSDFAECRLIGVNWNQWITPNQFSAPFSTITNCRMKYNNFMEMNLIKTDFSGCTITESLFGECRLAESSFNSCELSGTEFFKCDISKADFRNSVGYKIDIATNKMKGARFSFPEAINLLAGLGISIE